MGSYRSLAHATKVSSGARISIRKAEVKTGLLAMLLLTFTAASAAAQAQLDELIARAKSFELDTPYVPRRETHLHIMQPATPRSCARQYL